MKISLKQPEKINIGINNEAVNVKVGMQKVKSGTNNYKELDNLPSINDVVLIDNKTLDDLNIQIKGDYPSEYITNSEIEELLNNFAD